MWRATIYTDMGESYRLLVQTRSPSGRTGRVAAGKALLSLLEMLESYQLASEQPHSGEDDDIIGWFSELESQSKIPILQLTQHLRKAWYAGQFSEATYSILSDQAESPALREKSQHLARQISERWTEVDLLIEDTNALLQLLTKKQGNIHTGRNMLTDYVEELRVLAETLALAKDRDADQAVIQFA